MTDHSHAEHLDHEVRRYYESNTGRFLSFGGSGRSRAIHRGLWEPGVLTAEQAAARINQRIVEGWHSLGDQAPAFVRDLGCGVGGSLFHFAKAWPEAALEGITLSPAQAAIAELDGAALGLKERLTIECGDFLDSAQRRADLLVAIESHVHAASLDAFLEAAVAALNAEGRLIIVDDMLATPEGDLTFADQRLVQTFRRGWRLGHVPDVEALKQAAARRGLICRIDDDLTEHLRLDRWRDRLLHWIAPAADAMGAERWPICANMIGGNALTVAYQRGLMRYRFMLFELRASD